MKISDAVRKAVDLDDGDQWAMLLPTAQGIPHQLAPILARPDSRESYIFEQLGRGRPCAIARRTFVERADGTLRPLLTSSPYDPDLSPLPPALPAPGRRSGDRRVQK
jgi:hypothetical protein